MDNFYIYQILFNQYLIMDIVSQALIPKTKENNGYFESIREAKDYCRKLMHEILDNEHGGHTRSPKVADSKRI